MHPGPSYPAAPVRPERVCVGGLTFEDPYRWLEEDSPETLAWQEAQDALAEERLLAWSGFARLREAIARARAAGRTVVVATHAHLELDDLAASRIAIDRGIARPA